MARFNFSLTSALFASRDGAVMFVSTPEQFFCIAHFFIGLCMFFRYGYRLSFRVQSLAAEFFSSDNFDEQVDIAEFDKDFFPI